MGEGSWIGRRITTQLKPEIQYPIPFFKFLMQIEFGKMLEYKRISSLRGDGDVEQRTIGNSKIKFMRSVMIMIMRLKFMSTPFRVHKNNIFYLESIT